MSLTFIKDNGIDIKKKVDIWGCNVGWLTKNRLCLTYFFWLVSPLGIIESRWHMAALMSCCTWPISGLCDAICLCLVWAYLVLHVLNWVISGVKDDYPKTVRAQFRSTDQRTGSLLLFVRTVHHCLQLYVFVYVPVERTIEMRVSLLKQGPTHRQTEHCMM